MKKLHKQILIRQANLLDRVMVLIDVSRIKRFVSTDSQEWKNVVVGNNRLFNPMKIALKGLTVGQKAKLIRFLIRTEMHDVHSNYDLTGWANTYDVKSGLLEQLVAMGIVPEYSKDESYLTKGVKELTITDPVIARYIIDSGETPKSDRRAVAAYFRDAF